MSLSQLPLELKLSVMNRLRLRDRKAYACAERDLRGHFLLDEKEAYERAYQAFESSLHTKGSAYKSKRITLGWKVWSVNPRQEVTPNGREGTLSLQSIVHESLTSAYRLRVIDADSQLAWTSDWP